MNQLCSTCGILIAKIDPIYHMLNTLFKKQYCHLFRAVGTEY